MSRFRSRPPLLLATIAVVAVSLAGCADQALIDRVAQLESSQDRLRGSLTDLGAPDPDALAAREKAAADLASLEAQLLIVADGIDGLQVDMEGQVLDLDSQLTGTTLELDELRASIAQITAALAALTDRVSSLEVQLDAHRDDTFGHGG